MPKITENQIMQAKRAYLPNLVERHGYSVKQEGSSGRNYRVEGEGGLTLYQHRKSDLWRYHWHSKGQGGDSIDFFKDFVGKSWQDAVITCLDGACFELPKQTKKVESKEGSDVSQWQKSKKYLVNIAVDNLWKPENRSKLEWLKAERGLTDKTIKDFQIGWLPDYEKNNKKYPAKHLIPFFDNNHNLVRIRSRLWDMPKNKKRHPLIAGSDGSKVFELGMAKNKPVIIVESELDSILLYQCCQLHDIKLGVIGLGSAGVMPDAKQSEFLKTLPFIWLCLDNDKAGIEATNKKWLPVFDNAFNFPIPKENEIGKDVGEAWKKIDLKDFLEIGCEEASKKVARQRT